MAGAGGRRPRTVGLSEPLPARTSIASTWPRPCSVTGAPRQARDLGWIPLAADEQILLDARPRAVRGRDRGGCASSARPGRRGGPLEGAYRPSTGTAANVPERLFCGTRASPRGRSTASRRCAGIWASPTLRRSPTRSVHDVSRQPGGRAPRRGARAVAGQPAGDGRVGVPHEPGRHRHAAKLPSRTCHRPLHRLEWPSEAIRSP